MLSRLCPCLVSAQPAAKPATTKGPCSQVQKPPVTQEPAVQKAALPDGGPQGSQPLAKAKQTQIHITRLGLPTRIVTKGSISSTSSASSGYGSDEEVSGICAEHDILRDRPLRIGASAPVPTNDPELEEPATQSFYLNGPHTEEPVATSI